MIDKQRLLEQLRARVKADLEAIERRQQDTQAGATHEENRAEHAKDTRATEASYLARGLAKRVDELRRTRDLLAQLAIDALPPGAAVAVAALVTLRVDGNDLDAGEADVADRDGGARDGEGQVQGETDPEGGATPDGVEHWWLVPGAGGIELVADGVRVRTLTPASPMGRALMGLCAGDEGAFSTPRGERSFEVLEVG